MPSVDEIDVTSNKTALQQISCVPDTESEIRLYSNFGAPMNRDQFSECRTLDITYRPETNDLAPKAVHTYGGKWLKLMDSRGVNQMLLVLPLLTLQNKEKRKEKRAYSPKSK